MWKAAILVGLVAGSAAQDLCSGTGWFTWTGTAGTRPFKICAKRNDTAMAMDFRVEISGLSAATDYIAVALSDGTVGTFMSSGMDVMMINSNGAYRRLSSGFSEPQPFPGQTQTYGISNFVGSHSAGKTTASFTRMYSGGARFEHSLACCERTYTFWVVSSGPCGGGCSTTAPSFGYHGQRKTWTAISNFDTCPGLTPSACAPTTAAPTPAAPQVSTNLLDFDAVCAGKGGLSLPPPHTAVFKVCWEPRGANYKFFMQSTIGSAGYAAFGISSSDKMPDTEVYWFDTSSEQDLGGGLSMRYNSGYNPSPLCEPAATCPFILNRERRASGGIVQYTFERPIATNVSQHYDLSASNSYYLLYALNFNGQGKHTFKGTTKSQVSFASTSVAQAEVSKFSSAAKIAHGIMMILAWIFLSPVATFTARFTKDILPAMKWFNTHKYMQITAVVLTILAVIVVSTDENVDYQTIVDAGCDGETMECSKTHVQLGVAVTILALFQVVLGVARNVISQKSASDQENPHGPRRWIFNLLHKTTGATLLIITIINVSIGLKLSDEWVKEPAYEFFITAIVVCLTTAVLSEASRLPQTLSGKEKSSSQDSIMRHMYALMASTALAAAVTMSVAVDDSDDI